MSSYSLLHKEPLQRRPSSYTFGTREQEGYSTQILEQSKKLHIAKNYKMANQILSELLDKYPYTEYKEEVSFLLAKGFFYESNFIRSEEVIQNFKEYDPHFQSKWLGYSLLIMGQIYEQRGDKESAIQIYRQIITSFKDKNLVNEASNILLKVAI